MNTDTELPLVTMRSALATPAPDLTAGFGVLVNRVCQLPPLAETWRYMAKAADTSTTVTTKKSACPDDQKINPPPFPVAVSGVKVTLSSTSVNAKPPYT